MAQEQNYLHCTEAERLALAVTDGHVGYICYQIDGIDGWYEITSDLQWQFVGTRPKGRPHGYLARG